MVSKEVIDKITNSVTEAKEDTLTWLCSVNPMNSLITEEIDKRCCLKGVR